MRPGPATRTALLGKMFWPCSTHKAWGSAASVTALRREQRTHAFSRSPLAKRASRINLQHCGGRRPVLPCVEDSVRRPQRPGTSCAETHSGGTLPVIHPRELPGTASSAAMLWQGHRTSCLNVRHSALRPALHQEKSRDSLCRSCGCQRFLVESTGKAGCNSCSGHM
jgi:hypothetical protein